MTRSNLDRARVALAARLAPTVVDSATEVSDALNRLAALGLSDDEQADVINAAGKLAAVTGSVSTVVDLIEVLAGLATRGPLMEIDLATLDKLRPAAFVKPKEEVP